MRFTTGHNSYQRRPRRNLASESESWIYYKPIIYIFGYNAAVVEWENFKAAQFGNLVVLYKPLTEYPVVKGEKYAWLEII